MPSSNYPPGVSGNEPHITGEWPCDECMGEGGFPDEDDGYACEYCEGKGIITGDEKYFHMTYVCPGCDTDVKYNTDMDRWECSDSSCGDGVPTHFGYDDVLHELKEKQ